MEIFRTLKYHYYKDYNSVRVSITDNGVSKMHSFVEMSMNLIDLVRIKGVSYVIFDKSDTDFEISPYLYSYTREHIFQSLFQYGTRRIYFLVNDETFQRYKKIKDLSIMAFVNIDEIFAEINSINSN